jgi:hypothetical protein
MITLLSAMTYWFSCCVVCTSNLHIQTSALTPVTAIVIQTQDTVRSQTDAIGRTLVTIKTPMSTRQIDVFITTPIDTLQWSSAYNDVKENCSIALK